MTLTLEWPLVFVCISLSFCYVVAFAFHAGRSGESLVESFTNATTKAATRTKKSKIRFLPKKEHSIGEMTFVPMVILLKLFIWDLNSIWYCDGYHLVLRWRDPSFMGLHVGKMTLVCCAWSMFPTYCFSAKHFDNKYKIYKKLN